MKRLYRYVGPVKHYDDIVNSRWMAETYATSEAKARANLAYRYKTEHGYTTNSCIKVTGTLICAS